MIKVNGSEAFAFQCDISDREQVYRLAVDVRRRVGDVTILVNNAGIANSRHLLEIPDGKDRRQMSSLSWIISDGPSLNNFCCFREDQEDFRG